jgi:hypothetical protein
MVTKKFFRICPRLFHRLGSSSCLDCASWKGQEPKSTKMVTKFDFDGTITSGSENYVQ